MRRRLLTKGLAITLAAAMVTGPYSTAALQKMGETIVSAAENTKKSGTLVESPTVIDGMIYATVDMEYADFYYGELEDIDASNSTNLSLGEDKAASYRKTGMYDAVTSATTTKSVRFGATYYTENVSNAENSDGSGVNINGLKAVKIAIPEAVYNAYYAGKDGENNTHKAYDYLKNATYSDVAFDEYKTLNADGTFSKMKSEVTEDADATVSLSTTSSWGTHQLSIENLGDESNTVTTDNMLGVVVTTDDGKKYGMEHLDNLWLKTAEMSFATAGNQEDGTFKEPHGNLVPTERYKDMEGKTITNITYLIKDADDLSVDTDIYVKKTTAATASAEASTYDATENKYKVKINLTNVEPGVEYTLSKVQKGSKNATVIDSSQYSYDAKSGILTLDKSMALGSDYSVIFTNDEYRDIKVSFAVSPAVFDGYIYATVNMKYVDYYFGELNTITDQTSLSLNGDVATTTYADGEYDAVTSATTAKAKNFPMTYYDENVSNDETSEATGININGVKDVTIRVSKSLYDEYMASTDEHSAITYLKNATYLTEAKSEYKELNGDGTFKAQTGTTTKATSDTTASIVSQSPWGNWQISIANLPETVTSDNLESIVLEDSDGNKYGMLHEDNIWLRPAEIAFAAADNFVEPHGNHVAYKNTKDLDGKTITKITYKLRDANDIEINTSLYVKALPSANETIEASTKTVTYNPAGTSIDLNVSSQASETGYTLQGIIREYGNHQSETINGYTFEDGKLTIPASAVAGEYEATFSSDEKADIVVAFTIEKANQSITATSSYNKTEGDGDFSLDAKAQGALSYASSNAKVVTVDAKGTVQVKGAGTAKITVTAAATDYYKEEKKEITINVAKKPTTATTATTTTTKKVTFKKQTVKLKSKKKKQLTIQWKKDSNASGYQIKYGTKKSLKGAKTIKVKSYKTYKKTIKKLKSKKRYYVKVRAYKTVGKTTQYGKYSTRKSLKIK